MKTFRLVFFTIVFASSAMLLRGQQAAPEGQQRVEKVYTPKLPADAELGKSIARLNELLKDDYHCLITVYENQKEISVSSEKVVVFEDRIEYKTKNNSGVIKFSDILNSEICVKQLVVVYQNKDNTLKDGSPFIWVGNVMYIRFYMYKYDMNLVRQFADELFFLQHYTNDKMYNQQLALFELLAAQYRSLKVKPPVSEEQRKYIVQANALNEQKRFDKAIELYKKAVEIDQTAYPAAYSNLALLSAQLSRYDAAIYFMKKYLMLAPEAEDARSSQDKIYEWEVFMQ